jgi:hypothetical protein
MKILSVGILGLLVLASCGGQSDEDGRQGETVASDDDEEDAGPGKGKGGGNKGDDDAADDDTAGDDDAADDDTGGDDDAPGDDDTAGDDDAPTADDDGVADDDGLMPMPDPIPPDEPGVPVPTPPGPGMTPGNPGNPGEPLEDCQPVGQSQGTGYCDIQEQCSNGYKYSYCSQLASGNWQCSCSANSGSWELEVTADSAPCADVAALCEDISNPEFSDDETCNIELQSQSSDYCEKQVRCTRSAPISDTVSVVQSSYDYAYCYANGTELSCQCNSNNGNKSFSLADVAVAGACDVGLELCGSDGVVEPVGEATCTLDSEGAGNGYCERRETCTETVSVGGTQVTLSGPKYARCQTDGAGVTTCSCYNNSRSYSFEFSGAPDNAATCVDAMAVCDSNEELVPEGPVECGVTSQSASTGNCNANIQCTQDATVGGVVVGLNGNIYTYCQPNGDAWSCQCQSNTDIVTVDVESTDAWNACTEAAAQCPDLVDVEVTGSGGNPCYGYDYVVVAPGVPVTPGPGIPQPCYYR